MAINHEDTRPHKRNNNNSKKSKQDYSTLIGINKSSKEFIRHAYPSKTRRRIWNVLLSYQNNGVGF